jgi:glycine C-acetyltransferase
MNDAVINGPYITINSKILINLSSNDYLGIKSSKITKKQNQSSSRLIAGNSKSFKILENKLAKHKSQENSLIFPTGYMTNIGVITSLVKKNDLILSDEKNHASLIEACKMSDAKISIFMHNNMDDLESKIKTKAKRKFIITEGVFSMDGDFSNLKRISEISEKNNAITILDDAHGDFTLGDDGKGTADHFDVSKKIDVYTSSLSKGLGSFGGYVSSKKNVIELCINKSKPFIYTSALPTFLVDDAIKRFDSDREIKRKNLWKNVNMFSKGLKKIGFDVKSLSHIIPIIIGKEKTALEFGSYLFKNGIFAQPIRYPTVPYNEARIRVSITAMLTKNHITNSLNVFESAKKKFRL